MAEYTGESDVVSRVRRKTDEAAANGLPAVAGIANAALQYNGQDVIKRVAPAAPAAPAMSQQQIATAPAVAPVAQADQAVKSGLFGRGNAPGAEPLFDNVGGRIGQAFDRFNKSYASSQTQTLGDGRPAWSSEPDPAAAPVIKPAAAVAAAAPAVTLATPAKNGLVQPAGPVIASGPKKQPGQPDITVDQYLTQIAGDQAAGRQTGKMPRGVTGSVQVVGDAMDDNFRPGPKNGAVLTDAGYYTGSGFGNSPLAAGGGKTRMSEIAGSADQANQFRQQQAVARQQQIAAQPRQQNVPSVDDYLNKIDPMVRGLSPMRALRIANDARNNDLKMQLAGQEISQKGQQHADDLQQKRNELAAHKPVYDAQAGYYGAHAKLMEAQSSPEYLMRQERIAGIKDQAARAKETEKLQRDMAAKWVHGQTGMEHPDDIKTAMSYMGAQNTFNQNFDALIDKLAPSARKSWVDGFKAGDPAILEQLSRRGIVKPQAPMFPTRTPSTLGLQSEVK